MNRAPRGGNGFCWQERRAAAFAGGNGAAFTEKARRVHMDRQDKIAAVRARPFFRKGDIAVYAAVLLLVALFTLFAFLFRAGPGLSFSVVWQGNTVFSAPLGEDAVYVFTAADGKVRPFREGESYRDYNVIAVEDGQVSVREADCPDHVCEHFAATASGAIVCVPHGLRIEVGGEGVQTDL